jgi:hypothetical protein
MINGLCCCGAVAIELSEPPSMMATCHCSRCRKVGASVFVFVERTTLRLSRGADNIECYAPDAPYKYRRCLCRTCGTALGEILSDQLSFPSLPTCSMMIRASATASTNS